MSCSRQTPPLLKQLQSYALTGDAIPQEGNFRRHWIEAGWKPLSSALTDMTSVATDIVASENTVMMKYRMTGTSFVHLRECLQQTSVLNGRR